MTSPSVEQSQQATSQPKAITFIDGQNLYNDAAREFASGAPDYDVKKLSEAICRDNGWELSKVRFYTGIPSQSQMYSYRIFWNNKIRAMEQAGVKVTSRPLKDRESVIQLYERISVNVPLPCAYVDYLPDPTWSTGQGYHIPHDTEIIQDVFTEKGIDVSIAVDSIRHALNDNYNIFVFFSRDADLQPAVIEIKEIATKMKKPIDIYSAFPFQSKTERGGYGIPDTKTIRIDRKTYDECRDPNTEKYFPPRRNRR